MENSKNSTTTTTNNDIFNKSLSFDELLLTTTTTTETCCDDDDNSGATNYCTEGQHNNSKSLNITDHFSEWVHCMCIVTFDLELGQAMEVIYPTTAYLSDQEKMNICYLAFPDSNSSCMGDTQYHIRLRIANDSSTDSYQLNTAQKLFNVNCIANQRPDRSHYWGFVYFRQKRDASIARGYFQKSFILLTRLPFFNLFYEIVLQIAPKYFNDGIPLLQQVYEQIAKWPSLKAGEQFALPLLGTVYQTIIPKSNSKTHNSGATNNMAKISCRNCEKSHNHVQIDEKLPPQVLASVHEIDIFSSLSHYITNIYTLWELVLTSEPIVVMASSPTDCSHMVQSLISLISPLSYLAESRPYFTIHDSEFKEFTSINHQQNLNQQQQQQQQIISIIIGVTNPFFNKLLQNWPHMIKLPDRLQYITQKYDNNCNNKNNKFNNSNNNNTQSSIISMVTSTAAAAATTTTSTATSAATNLTGALIKNNSNNNDNSLPGLYTKYKSFLKKDKNFIKKIQLGEKTKRPVQVQSALIRRHFLELTQSFMIPLERYMASLMPLQKDISPFKSAPNPNKFQQDEFLATLELSGPQLTSSLKGNWKGLYKKFFKSVNFRGWYENRNTELKHTLQTLQLQALSDADLNKWAQGKQEVEIIDMIIKLKQKLKLSSDSLASEDILHQSTQLQLLKQLDNITNSLPDDLKTIIN